MKLSSPPEERERQLLSASVPKPPPSPPIRQNFPETWIWAEPNIGLRELGNEEMGKRGENIEI
jgi:hypothetical protein